MPAVALLLGKLPPFSNTHVIIEKRQSVHDIIREVLTAHRYFASHYDTIAADFWQGDVFRTCVYLWQFCKNNIRYDVETEASQTTKSPAAMLNQATGDCKHYSGFIGGVLDALKRQGKKIDWRYRFASYNGSREPEHVFIVVRSNGRELWIDPVLKNFNERLRPTNFIDKKISMLTRLSGIGDVEPGNYPVNDLLSSIDYGLTPDLYNAIQLLLKYGVMDVHAKVNAAVIENKYKKFPDLQNSLRAALSLVNQAAIGGLFGDIWRGVKKVTLAPLRGAYLSLVAINAFGYATKLKTAIYNADGSFSTYKDKIKTLWQDRFAGDFSALLNTVNNGATKRAILGAAPAVAAWAVTAAAIIAAITPIVTAALKARQTQTQMNYAVDPLTGQPYGTPAVGTGSIMDWIRENPAIVAAGLAGVYFLTRKKRSA
jgi:hypothetical protein